MEVSPLTLLMARPWFLVYFLLFGGGALAGGAPRAPILRLRVRVQPLPFSQSVLPAFCRNTSLVALVRLRSSRWEGLAAVGAGFPGAEGAARIPGPGAAGQVCTRPVPTARSAGCSRVGSGSRAAVGDCRG